MTVKSSAWNEGTLPAGLSLDALKRQHPSRPHNPLLADVCFKGGYIDAWGRGTLKIINSCREAALPEPVMLEQDGGLLVEIYKHRFTEEELRKSDLNDRQIKAVLYVVENGSVSNSEYQKLTGASERTALRDLDDLVVKQILEKKGAKKSTRYVLPGG